jgi:hypothetical protein
LAFCLKGCALVLVVVRGQYVVYERATKEEESLFLEIAAQVVAEIEEPANWKKVKDPGKRGGGRPYEYGFRPMLLILMLMVRDRKDYRETASHLRNDPRLLVQLGLDKAPSKSSIHSAAARIGLDTLADVNDGIIARFKKILEDLERSM